MRFLQACVSTSGEHVEADETYVGGRPAGKAEACITKPLLPRPLKYATANDWSGYAGLTKRGYDHVSIAERGDPQVAEEFMPIVHLVFSNLKTWLRGIHHGVSPQHL